MNLTPPSAKSNWSLRGQTVWKLVFFVVVFAIFASSAYFGDLLCEALQIVNLSSECKELWLWFWRYSS